MPLEEMSWTNHPARWRKGAAAVTLAGIAIMGALVGVAMEDWIWGALSTLALFLATSRFFLPTRVSVTDSGVEVAYPFSRRTIDWASVGCVMWRSTRVVLASAPTRRAMARGVHFDTDALSPIECERLRARLRAKTRAEAWA